MTREEKAQLMLLISGTSAYYGQELRDDVLALYVEDLEDLSFAHVAAAIKAVRRDPKTTRFPLPALIRDKIAPQPTEENDAAEAAARIAGAVRRYGWTNSDRAREYIGELGWRVVQLDGGWQNVCETLTEDNLGTYRAQWRGLALSVVRRVKAGQGEAPPALPEGPRQGGELTSFGGLLAQIESKRTPERDA